jgi:hypothetical protein
VPLINCKGKYKFCVLHYGTNSFQFCFVKFITTEYLSKIVMHQNLFFSFSIFPQNFTTSIKSYLLFKKRSEINIRKMFWEELIAYFFTVIWISDMTGRKKILVCMHNEGHTVE